MVRPDPRRPPLPRALGGRRWVPWTLALGAWTLLALLSASQRYLQFLGEGESRITWLRAFAWQAPGWYLWALYTPLILWAGRRFPLERRRWRRALAAHIPLALVLAVAHIAFHVWVSRRAYPKMLDYPFREQVVGYMSSLFHIDLLIYGAVLGVGYAYEYARRYREREVLGAQLEAQLAQAQLQALRMQLNPHFLFNALNAVATLVRTGDDRGAVRMLAGLGDLLRRTLEGSETQEVRLEEELDFLGRYLEIEQIRFRDRLRVRIDVPAEVLDARVPSLILQPLVENAVKHGIGPRAAAGEIEIAARRVEGMLELRVRDDGPGLPPGWRPGGAGVGLGNTRSRLEKFYPARCRLELADADGGGVVALVALPFRLAPTAWEAEP